MQSVNAGTKWCNGEAFALGSHFTNIHSHCVACNRHSDNNEITEVHNFYMQRGITRIK
jgi:hypothetical protein